MTTHNPDHDGGRGDWQEYLTTFQLDLETQQVIDQLQLLILEGETAEQFADKANLVVLQAEIAYLSSLLERFIRFVIRAESCGCGNCKKSARNLKAKLIDELIRQTERPPAAQSSESLDPRFLDQQSGQKAIALAEKKLQEKSLKEWENRAKRIRQLIKIFIENKEANFSDDPFTPKERAEIQRLIKEAKARAKKRKK